MSHFVYWIPIVLFTQSHCPETDPLSTVQQQQSKCGPEPKEPFANNSLSLPGLILIQSPLPVETHFLSVSFLCRATKIGFSSNGKILIAHCEDNTVHEWSIAEFIQSETLIRHDLHTHTYTYTAFILTGHLATTVRTKRRFWQQCSGAQCSHARSNCCVWGQ